MEVVLSAQSFLRTFDMVRASQSLALHSRYSEAWERPPSGLVKVNFVGAVFEGGKEGGIGVIARDYAGQCLVWCFVQI
ncbi:UNVERIFIED_CONTAM: hypothetical protein Slati_1726000 [Sesamum latifolium]|uniref:Uncharacterized protein n=1 Tax=Sesamum latifolium TaxID=2727402 RepID=A0AAW2WYW0_9LAMI